MINWLKYSGATISITVNPYHWAWVPIIRNEADSAWEDNTFRISVFFLTVRIWIDDGSW